ncbi:hypothetical protein [Nitrosococcus wardiae]|nr:hypothetical protein [Nitrosococcus wardiae]
MTLKETHLRYPGKANADADKGGTPSLLRTCRHQYRPIGWQSPLPP